jgi:hypothetical protein
VKRAAVLALVVMCSACSKTLVRQGAAPPPQPSAAVGRPLLTVTAAPRPTIRIDSGPSVVVVLTDVNGAHPAGIPVHVNGRVLTSDADGQVKVFGPGRYTFEVSPVCTPVLQVTSDSHQGVRVSRGATGTVNLPVRWRHRYAPAPPVESDLTGGWPIGELVHLHYTVRDRCTDEIAPNASFPTFELEPGSPIRIVGRPALASDARGYGTVTLECVATGDPHLVAADKANASDTINLTDDAVDFSGRPVCKSA